MPATPPNPAPQFERVVSTLSERPEIPLADLVVVDRHEAQGWRVRRHERLDLVFEERCDWIREYGRASQLAVDGAEISLTYDELDARANRLARYLRLHGTNPADRVALLFDDHVEAYVATLAVLKIGATCVPLDPTAPVDRLAFIVADTSTRIVLSRSHLRGRVAATEALLATSAEVLAVDGAARLIAEMSPQRLQPTERGALPDQIAYIVHLPNSSGWSEGVSIDHRSMCNAVRTSSETFGIGGHRVYQGKPLCSGGGIEETWMAWVAGATLVSAPEGPHLRGPALHAELVDRRVSALCTTPALLSTLEADLPALRVLVVAGEPCPPSLVARWQRPGRRFFTAYVPAGATVAAAWTEALPDKPVMIGAPLPTYATVVLDADYPLALPHGETGEIGLAGLGLTCGYLNPSGEAFVEDFLDIPGNPTGKIYRTGDLGRVNEAGEVEYRGRLAAQTSVAGHRIDLIAVESTMMAVPGVTSAVVHAHHHSPDVELVGYYTCCVDRAQADEETIWAWLRERLDADHVPARLQRLEELPLTADGCVDRAALASQPAADAELDTLRSENARLQEQLDGLRHPPPDAGPTTSPAPPLKSAEPGILTFDQIIKPASAPAVGSAPSPEPPPGSLTFDLAAPPPAPTPAATTATSSRRPTPYPRSPAQTPAQPSPRPTPYPRPPGQAPALPTPTPRPTPYPRSPAPTSSGAPLAPAPPVSPTGSSHPAPVDAEPTADLAAALASVLADVLTIEHVSVASNVFDDLGADSMVMTRFCARLRKREDLPSVSIKDVYAHPTIAGLAAAFAGSTPPPTPALGGAAVAEGLAEVLAEVLGVEHVPVDRNVFDDLGADSMVMTRFCARLRKREDLPSVSIKDVYAHPTIASMAAAAIPSSAATESASPVRPAARVPVVAEAVPVRHSTVGYLLTGVLQLLVFLLYVTGAGYVMDRAYVWISTSVGLVEIYLRSLEAGALAFLAMALLPVVAKWVLVGRWKETEFPVWSLRYFRFWLAKTLIRGNPLALLMVGSPLYTLYLRLLGAKVGKNVVILTRHVPVCTDLISIGSGTVVRKDVYLLGYRAHAGRIQQGRVTLGRDVVVGEKSVLDIGTAMGDGAQLGHASSLHRGQTVAAEERWHGSPPIPTDTDFVRLPPVRVPAVRKFTFVASQLVKLFAIYLPLGFGGLFMLLTGVPQFKALLDPGALGHTTSAFYVDALVGSTFIVFGGLFLGLAVVFTAPRAAALFVRPDRVYPLYGWRYSLHRAVFRLTNIKLFVTLFGDSSYIVGYLYLLGYDLGKVEQTGSNFGSMVAQETPYLVSVGAGTVIADGLSVNNAEFSSTSFRASRAAIGAHNFLGNHIGYPAGGRTGDDCLLATKVAIPIDGPVRQGVGLLGSPAFEIPRTVARDRAFEIIPEERRRRLGRKNAHNALTIAFALVVRWGHVLGLLLLGLLAVDHYADLGPAAFAAEVAASVLFSLLWFIFWERAVVGFRRIRPKSCSIYDVRFWRHERYWKLTMPPLERLLAGTPYHNLVARMLGLRIGRRVFDDGASITERTMTAVGDDCTLNIGSIIQCHSQEDGAFKSDRSTLGAGVTLGVGTLVHYGVSVGDAVEIEPDSFVMKGEEVPAGARWGGNPAQELDDPAQQLLDASGAA
ncbi:AMP-binding protein [Pseudonocardia sp. RS11V-5]|uniref:Pls/PosA family non-ribosomal peptide synthetase n=1 Tax=Pseudonocardia terrae TaxID=2905831 RepID=UPI001E2F9C6D|nr:Pls/PosA family non-ribosomal peptide synthetase [Pseudonocardia terrae]MCE3555476.1 AMP-binding protein [Pseudonocardia terrae]